jgi:hypothetical protein
MTPQLHISASLIALLTALPRALKSSQAFDYNKRYHHAKIRLLHHSSILRCRGSVSLQGKVNLGSSRGERRSDGIVDQPDDLDILVRSSIMSLDGVGCDKDELFTNGTSSSLNLEWNIQVRNTFASSNMLSGYNLQASLCLYHD